eukprot:Gregarina_sp_Poly_1__5873@NODE_3096_length_1386_cov_73_652009_g1960_i0_p1_GENE_NODE_3096_length_1386_cov_73_652009_g1960_i0NODE_3096_length_1386_cov_73_652009_g1960_i0_p1_ORF_typecomplete_len204_score14_83CENPF_leu_zip/PF10473_9/9_8e05GAS/PF13851_6/0_00019Spc24/PF08286_11/44Spc24/PF08286_11/0_0093CCDC144C/PF14915_6/0_014CCDC144C/PF14915_6/0_31Rab5bind/PF09311_11/0_00043MT/PF12777_7/0_00045WEMBL/PF05701_11/0_00071MAD/PF05557_13/0_0015UPF0242/PF06785_11/0_0023Myosin_tail_1/PF01576_19/0_0038Fez1/PF
MNQLTTSSHDITILFNKTLNHYADRQKISDSRRCRIERENANLRRSLEHTQHKTEETEEHIRDHVKNIESLKATTAGLKTKLEQCRDERAKLGQETEICKRNIEETMKRQIGLLDLFHRVLGVRILIDGDGKRCIVLDHLLPQRENLSCSILCVHHKSRMSLIPMRVDPHQSRLSGWLKRFRTDDADLFQFVFLCRLLYKANT